MEHYVEQALIEDIRLHEKLRTEDFIEILNHSQKHFKVKNDDNTSKVTITLENGLRYIPTSVILTWINEYEIDQNPDTFKRNDSGIRTKYDYIDFSLFLQQKFLTIRNLVYISWNNLPAKDKINRYVGRLPFWYVYEKVYNGDNHQRFWLNQCVLMRIDDNEVDLLFAIQNNFQTEKRYSVITQKFSNTIVYDGMRQELDISDIRNASYNVIWFNRDRGSKSDNEESLGYYDTYLSKHWYDTFNREHYHAFTNESDLQKYLLYNLYRTTQEQEIIIRSNEYTKFRRLIYDSRLLGDYYWDFEGYDMITIIKMLSISTLKISSIKEFPTNFADCIRFVITNYQRLIKLAPITRDFILNSKYIYLSDWQYKIIKDNPNHPPYDSRFIKIITTDENAKPLYNILPQSEQGVPGIIIDIPTGDVIDQLKEEFLENVSVLSHDKYKLGMSLANVTAGLGCITSLQSHIDDNEENRLVYIDTDAKFKSLIEILTVNGEIKRRLSDEMRFIQFGLSSNLEYNTYNSRLYQIFLFEKTGIARKNRNGSALKILNLSLFSAEIINKRLISKNSINNEYSDLLSLKTTFLYWGSIGEDGAKFLSEYYPKINTVCIGDNAIRPNLIGKLENVSYTGSPSVIISDINVFISEGTDNYLEYYREQIRMITQNLISQQAIITIFKIQYPYHFLLQDIKDTINNKIYSGRDLVDANYNIYFLKVGASPAISAEIFCFIIQRNLQTTTIDGKPTVTEIVDGEIRKRGMLKSNTDNNLSLDIYISLRLLPTCGTRVYPSNVRTAEDIYNKRVQPGDLIVLSAEMSSISEAIGMTSSLCAHTLVNTTNVNGIISSSICGFVNDIRWRLFKYHNTYRYNTNSLGQNRLYKMSNESEVIVNRLNTNPVRYISQFRRFALRCLIQSLSSIDNTIANMVNTVSIGGGNYNEIGIVGTKTYIFDLNTRELNIDIPNLYIIRDNWRTSGRLIDTISKDNSLVIMFDSYFLDSAFTNDELVRTLRLIQIAIKNIRSNRLVFSIYEIDTYHLDAMLNVEEQTPKGRKVLVKTIIDYINENDIQMTSNIMDIPDGEFSYKKLRYSFGGYGLSPTITSDDLISIFPLPDYSLHTLNLNITDIPECNHVETLRIPNSTICVDNLVSMFARAYYVIRHR